ncbi:hypothetical protein [uncultured Thiodictyon sp.]|uniref:hypothetical protein n=1 Tax=uncultured Thiodictyon sp. TaxID=1846217 RepID=UPI0025CE700E|nr:hypothetical protein [uncultured Thiodictyon sp.]
MTPAKETAARHLWSAIREVADRGASPRPRGVSANTADIIKNGGAMVHVVDDLLYALDIGHVGCRDLALLAQIPVHTLYWRPSASARNTWGGDGLTAVQVAVLLVYAERWALPVDPEPLVLAALPALRAKKLLTHPELAVLWWAKERHRNDIKRFPDVDLADCAGSVELPTGYRACAGAWGLVIASPKTGKRPWRFEVELSGALTPRPGVKS